MSEALRGVLVNEFGKTDHTSRFEHWLTISQPGDAFVAPRFGNCACTRLWRVMWTAMRHFEIQTSHYPQKSSRWIVAQRD